MPIIAGHHQSDPWRPSQAWRNDDRVQWGHPERPWGGIGTAFFEVFPREGSYVRGEGDTTQAAEADCFQKIVKHRGCHENGGHAWSRKFDNGLAECRACGATQPYFKPIVVLGAWKEPLWLHELRSVFSGHLEPVDHPELKRDSRDVRNRRTWLRFKMHGVELPPIPEVPKDILQTTPFQLECQAVVLELIRAGGGLEVFDKGELVLDGRLVARMERGMFGLKREYEAWERKGFPDLRQKEPDEGFTL